MKRVWIAALFLCTFAGHAGAQSSEAKFIADTLVVQAEGTYEADPDLATLMFDVSSQDKDMKVAYANATQSMQHIVALATQNGMKREDVSTGVLTVQPSYERDRKNKPKLYTVGGQITLKVHDFSAIGALLDGAVQEGIVDFRSLTYSLQDEESAKQKAVAEAMRRAVARAATALEQSGQKAGPVRYVNLDVRQPINLASIQPVTLTAETVEVSGAATEGFFARDKKAAAPPPPPPVQPGKISVTAMVQCAFEIK